MWRLLGLTLLLVMIAAASCQNRTFDPDSPHVPVDCRCGHHCQVTPPDATGSSDHGHSCHIERPDCIRGIYVPMTAISDQEHISSLVDFVLASGLNTVVIDVKDSSGRIFWDTQSLSAFKINAVLNETVDVSSLVSQLLAEDIYPVARIAVFKDPLAATAFPVWADPDHPLWLNPLNADVWEYIVELSLEIADMGFPAIMYDEVRFGGGGLGPPQATRVATITGFLDHCRNMLLPYNVEVVAAVTGYAVGAACDSGTGHQLAAIADSTHLISPTLLLSQLLPGTFGIGDPLAYPEDVLTTAMRYATNTVLPESLLFWLEDSSKLSPEDIADQIVPVEKGGAAGWILYNPEGMYTPIDYPVVDSNLPATETEVATGPLPPNELGRVLILAYHHIGPEESRWCRSIENFANDLQMLYDEGFRLISLTDYLDGTINVAAGYSPVVITFDDSTAGQFQLIASDGMLIVDPKSGVGMLLDFYQRNPDFGLASTFYVLLPHPFGNSQLSGYKLQWLVEVGLEIGNHTLSHANLRQVSTSEAQRQIALPVKQVQTITGGYTMDSLALPYGAYPQDPSVLVSGEYDGTGYHNRAVLLVGSDPAPSPFSTKFDPYLLPRVQAIDSEFDRWLSHFRANPDDRYVSDGNPDSISYPESVGHLVDHNRAKGKTLNPY